MSDFKSKLPDFKELASMTGKLYKGIKNSVEEIIHDYKEKRAETETAGETEVKTEVKTEATENPVETAEKPKSSEETPKE